MATIESKFITPENREWAEAAAQGRLLVKHCQQCETNHYYPRAHCPFCGSADTEYLPVSGQATIYTFAPNRVSRDLLINAYVTLAEGPTIMTRIVGADPDQLAIGQPVELDFEDSRMGFPVPVFKPLTRANP